MFDLTAQLLAQAEDWLNHHTRAQLPQALAADAHADLLSAVNAVPRWTLVTRLGGRHLDLDAAAMDAMPPAQKAEFDHRVQAGAAEGFQYLYETYPLYDKWHGGVLADEAPVLADLYTALNSADFLDPMRQILDAPEISFADAQLTRYRAGHFLTTHDDGNPGKNRVAAFVLTLSEDWQERWGGVLQFETALGAVTERFVPRGNTLSLFKVPQPHQVTPVAAGVPAHRVSVTGWLRTGDDPGPVSRAS
ncbi:2OG-Fe(II) oxygenase [Maricaulis sp.]|uniref:2OG-Fe(II) oxygenase n=1 Tax=Maricaulis sp. TaxID=1486257 RepID=UPI002B2720CF|nr:2OG-Fe(II) oxygenase family protein [Maricaulis sp.]